MVINVNYASYGAHFAVYTDTESLCCVSGTNKMLYGKYCACMMGFPGSSEVKAPACNAGDLCSIPGSGRSPGEGNGNPLQYSCLENPMEPGRLQSTGSQRVGHDWATSLSFSCLVMSNSFVTPWAVATRLFCPWNFPGKNIGVGCHFLLQGNFPTQGLNPHILRLLHFRLFLYHWATMEIHDKYNSIIYT